ncbi:FlgO family outer membrane protein [Elusimicrobiota bacterium]
MNKSQAVLLTFFALIFCADNALFASEITGKLDKLAKNLIKGYKDKKPDELRPTIAILNFSASKKLQKQRAGFAVAELITQRFVKKTDFKVVERMELQKLLTEQGLAQTETVDAQKAVKAGKILGAHILVLGSIEKLGGEYQVHARMVDVETAQVLAVDYQAVPTEAFKEEANPYLRIHPDGKPYGEIDIYGFYRTRFIRGSCDDLQCPPTYAGEPLFVSGVFGGPMQITQKDYTLAQIGIGAKYYFRPKWFLDGSFAYLPSTVRTQKFISTGKCRYGVFPNYMALNLNDESYIDTFNTVSLSVNHDVIENKRFKASAGIGTSRHNVKAVHRSESHIYAVKEKSFTAFLASMEGSYRLTRKAQINLSATWETLDKLKFSILPEPIEFSPISYELSIAVYF